MNIDLGGIYFNLFEYLLHYNIFTVNNTNENISLLLTIYSKNNYENDFEYVYNKSKSYKQKRKKYDFFIHN